LAARLQIHGIQFERKPEQREVKVSIYMLEEMKHQP